MAVLSNLHGIVLALRLPLIPKMALYLFHGNLLADLILQVLIGKLLLHL